MSSRRGATIITLITSIVILAIALAAAASAFLSASKLTRHAGCVTTASNFAESVMERVRTEPFGSIKSTVVARGLPKLPGASCAVAVSTPEPGLKEIVVTCSWIEGRTPCSARYATLVAGGRRP